MQIKEFAPVVLFVYNRPEHTKRTVEALKQNDGAKSTELYVFCDYPKNEKAALNVEKTVSYVKKITGFKQIHITLRNENFGLAKSIIDGVTKVVNKYGRVIVMEDDLITSRYFLRYMNEALELYKEQKQVFSVTGFSHFPNGNPKLAESYFLKVFSSWTWATWSDRWVLFDPLAEGWEETKYDAELARRFDYEHCLDNCLMLRQQMEEHIIDSWAIRAYWTMFKQDGLTLFPNTRLCENIGFDGTGVHCNTVGDYKEGTISDARVLEFPAEIEELAVAKKEFVHQIRKKKRAYKRMRMWHYLLHPMEALKKIRGKLKR